MLPLAIATLLIGVVFLFLVPAVGLVVGIVGVVLLIVYLVGWGRRVTEPRA